MRVEGKIQACNKDRDREVRGERKKKKKHLSIQPGGSLILTYTCTRCMNPQESDEGERQYEAQMYGAEKHSVNKLPV